MAGRLSQEILESLYLAAEKARLSQEAVESLYLTAEKARLSQEAVESLYLTGQPARVSQLVVEVLYAAACVCQNGWVCDGFRAGWTSGWNDPYVCNCC